MDSNRHDPLGDDGDGWLYVLGRIAWRLVQAALVTAGVVALLYVFGGRGGGDTREKAYIAATKADLRNLVTAQESYFEDYRTFAPSLAALGAERYTVSTGTTLVIDSASGDWFVASATHANTRYRCGIFIAGAPVLPTPLLSWTWRSSERHDLLRTGDSTRLERWPGHEERFRVAGRDTVLGSTGTVLRRIGYPPVDLFVRDRGQPLGNVLWREGGPWHMFGPIVNGSDAAPPDATPEPARPRIGPPWPGAKEGAPICWRG